MLANLRSNPHPQVPESKTADRAIWREDFEHEADRTIIDGGSTAWKILGASDAPFGTTVSNGKFRARDAGREIVWETDKIDIGEAKRISIAVDAIKIGNFEPDSDSLRIYYRLGDGDEKLIDSLSFSSDPQEDFETYRIRKHDINVSGNQQAQVIIRSRINGDDFGSYPHVLGSSRSSSSRIGAIEILVIFRRR